ncbi:MAG: hypothetical protein JWO36_6685 [Myxococcales bacterium]|nr:hypothetical protein [Myxococcales bacterium]
MSSLRDGVRYAAYHAALLVAIWLFAIQVYAVAFTASASVAWLALDLAVIAGTLVVVHRNREHLGLGSLGEAKLVKLAGLVCVSLACVAASQWVIVDLDVRSLDENNYLSTLRAGHIVRDGFAPFNMRWLEPVLAGVGVLPVGDADALKAMNFGALVVTCVYLALLLIRMRVRFSHAAFAPVFLVCSYLGTYAGTNRLVLDPFNYAMFVVLFHVLLRREHWKYFPWLLLIAAFNSEKAIYWVPVFGAVAWLDTRRLRDAVVLTLRYGTPTVLYLVTLAFYVRRSQTENGPLFLQNVYFMSFTWLHPKITNETVRANNFQILWFPFGAFTMYTLLGLASCKRALRPFVLLLIPVFLQALIGHDTSRMIAYAFIVYLPFGYLYLARALHDLPRIIGRIAFALLVVLAIAESYLLPLADKLGRTVVGAKFYLSFADVIVAAAFVALHLLVYDE